MAARNLTDAELAEALTGLPGWRAEAGELVRTFSFGTFRDAVSFVVRVANAAEEADHHPDIDIRYTDVRVACRTHVTGGISRRDVDLARVVDALAEG